MTTWIVFGNGRPEDLLGFIPTFLDDNDERPAAEQFNKRYIGGWRPMKGFTVNEDLSLSYTSDPPMHPVAMAYFRDEIIYVYPYAWVMIVQKDGSHEISHMD